MEIKCDNCGHVIQGRRNKKNKHNFCNNKCQGEWQSKNKSGKNHSQWKGGNKIIFCDNCGNEIERGQSQIGKHNFCDKKCQGEWQSKNRRGENSAHWKGGNEIIICDNCGNEIKRKSSQINEHNFCDRKCYGEWRTKNIKGENHSQYIEKIIKKCEVCGNDMEILPSSTQKCCSEKCRNKYYSINFSGENNINSKPKIEKICEWCGGIFYVSPNEESRKFCSRWCFGKYQSKNKHIKTSLKTRIKISCGLRNISIEEFTGFAEQNKYCQYFNESLRMVVRNYFDNKCFITGEIEDNGNALSVHHVNYDKKCGCDSLQFCIYIPVLAAWNTKFNYDRYYWQGKLLHDIFIRHPNYYQFHIPVWGFNEMYYNYEYVFEKTRKRINIVNEYKEVIK